MTITQRKKKLFSRKDYLFTTLLINHNVTMHTSEVFHHRANALSFKSSLSYFISSWICWNWNVSELNKQLNNYILVWSAPPGFTLLHHLCFQSKKPFFEVENSPFLTQHGQTMSPINGSDRKENMRLPVTFVCKQILPMWHRHRQWPAVNARKASLLHRFLSFRGHGEKKLPNCHRDTVWPLERRLSQHRARLPVSVTRGIFIEWQKSFWTTTKEK